MTTARRGRNRITARALDRVATAVAADELGVQPKSVSVDASDDAGMLQLAVSSPIRIASLTRVQRDPAVVERTGGSLLERAARAQDGIRARVTELTGSGVSRVMVRLTGVTIVEEKRVG